MYEEPVSVEIRQDVADALRHSATRIDIARRIALICGAWVVIRALSSSSPIRILATAACVAIAVSLIRLRSAFREAGDSTRPDTLSQALDVQRQSLWVTTVSAAAIALITVIFALILVLPTRISFGGGDSNEQKAVDELSAVANAIDALVIETRAMPAATDFAGLRAELLSRGLEIEELDPWGRPWVFTKKRDEYQIRSDGNPETEVKGNPWANNIVLSSGTFRNPPDGVRIDEARR